MLTKGLFYPDGTVFREEDFAHWRAMALAITRGGLPRDTARLERAVERLKPAHLEVVVAPGADLAGGRWAALHGGAMTEVTGDDIQRAKLATAPSSPAV